MNTWTVLFLVLMLGNTNVLLAGGIMKLTENDSGKTFEINVGDDLEIVLSGNPTTGYVWEVSSLDSDLLKQNKSDFLAIDKAIGGGGMEIIKLHAISQGTSEVRLIFHRPFERNVPPVTVFSATVVIKR